MYEKPDIIIYQKYIPTVQWLDEISMNDTLSYNDLIASAKRHTMQITGCSSKEYDELKSNFRTLMSDYKDSKIFYCYYEYLESIRKARQ